MNALRPPTPQSWQSLAEILAHVLFTRHPCLRQNLAYLSELTDRVARERVVSPGLTDRLQREFLALADLLETDLAGQECWLHPVLRQLRTHSDEAPATEELAEALCGALDQANRTNREALGLTDRLLNHLSGPEWVDRGPLAEELIDALGSLRAELASYARLEAQDLFPTVRGLLRAGDLADEPGRLVAIV